VDRGYAQLWETHNLSKNLFSNSSWKGAFFVRDLLVSSLLSLLTGAAVGLLFAFLRLPIPAPPTIPAVFGIIGITIGFLIFRHFFGGGV
jgi:XapX domain-containing protein